MTMPHERMRAIRCGFETLNEAVSAIELSEDLRQKVKAVLQRYPSATQLKDLLTQDGATLPTDWGEALNSARSILNTLHLRGSGDRLGWSAEGALRHFPDAGDVAHFLTTPTLPNWLEPEATVIVPGELDPVSRGQNRLRKFWKS